MAESELERQRRQVKQECRAMRRALYGLTVDGPRMSLIADPDRKGLDALIDRICDDGAMYIAYLDAFFEQREESKEGKEDRDSSQAGNAGRQIEGSK